MSLSSGTSRKLHSQDIELVNEDVPRGEFRSVLFDFDGTISLIREGWRGIMIPLMAEILADLGVPTIEDIVPAIKEEFRSKIRGIR